jgi:serine/threonine-protein kinase RsbW
MMKKSTLKIKSVPANIHSLERFVENICDEYNINNTYFGNILITLTEAMENALYHGNKSDPEKYIIIKFESKSKGLLFEISDEGKGFDFNNIPDATDVQGNPERKGTGLYLIKALADEVKFKSNGSTIQIMFYISSINQQLAVDRISQLNAFKKTGKEIKENRN